MTDQKHEADDASRGGADAPLPRPAPTLLDAVLSSISTPGASSGLVATINGVLLLQAALFGAFAASGAAGDELRGHFAVLTALSLGLLVAFNAFLLYFADAIPVAAPPPRDEASDKKKGR